MTSRLDPSTSFRFVVQIDSIEVAAFSEVSGLVSEVAVIEYRDGTDIGTVRKIPGRRRFPNIVLRRGVVISTELFDWHRLVSDGRTPMEDVRRDGSVMLLNEAGEPAARFNFRNGWPVKWEGPTLNARSDEIAIETLEICHEGLEYSVD